MMEEYSNSSRSNSPLFEYDTSRDASKEDAARQALEVFSDLLEHASTGLDELSENKMLGSAIVRKSQELADAVGGLAESLHNQSDEERRALAQACLQDAESLLLTSSQAATDESDDAIMLSHQLSHLSQEDMMEALSGAESLLVDVEGALRSIGQDEADEIADVAVTLARLFVASLQSFLSTLTPQQLAGTYIQDSGRVEIVQEETNNTTNTARGGINTNSNNTTTTAVTTTTNKNKKDRIRVLWPPLGPAVASVLDSTKQACLQQPLLAVALGLTLWPAAVVTAVVSTPILVGDAVLQHFYNCLNDGPVVATLERGAAQLYHASRLSLLCSGLAWRQTWRVANKQLERHGGVGRVAHDLANVAKDRATHPIETCAMTWDGIVWGASMLQKAAVTLHEVASREMEREMDKTCQSLQ